MASPLTVVFTRASTEEDEQKVVLDGKEVKAQNARLAKRLDEFADEMIGFTVCSHMFNPQVQILINYFDHRNGHMS